MPCVIGAFFGFDEHIISINLHGFTDQRSEYLGHHPLISCPSVFQAKQHYVVAVPCGVMKVVFSTSGECIGI